MDLLVPRWAKASVVGVEGARRVHDELKKLSRSLGWRCQEEVWRQRSEDKAAGGKVGANDDELLVGTSAPARRHHSTPRVQLSRAQGHYGLILGKAGWKASAC